MAETPEEQQARIKLAHQAAQDLFRAQELGMEPSDEPTFTLRAQDILSVMAIDHYNKLLEMYHPHSDKLASAVDKLNEFREWQHAHPEKIRIPD